MITLYFRNKKLVFLITLPPLSHDFFSGKNMCAYTHLQQSLLLFAGPSLS